MPNIVAHAYVTTEVLGERPRNRVLGSTLPDFAHMYRDTFGGRVAIRGIDAVVDGGIDFHQTTDRLYKDQPEVATAKKRLIVNLEAAGIAERAARLTADLGSPLLLDRVLLELPEPRAALENLKDAIVLQGGTAIQRTGFNPDFKRYVFDYFDKKAYEHYADADELARIIQQRLAKRSSLPDRVVTEAQTPALAEVLKDQGLSVGRLCITALGQTIQDLRALRVEQLLAQI